MKRLTVLFTLYVLPVILYLILIFGAILVGFTRDMEKIQHHHQDQMFSLFDAEHTVSRRKAIRIQKGDDHDTSN